MRWAASIRQNLKAENVRMTRTIEIKYRSKNPIAAEAVVREVVTPKPQNPVLIKLIINEHTSSTAESNDIQLNSSSPDHQGVILEAFGFFEAHSRNILRPHLAALKRSFKQD